MRGDAAPRGRRRFRGEDVIDVRLVMVEPDAPPPDGRISKGAAMMTRHRQLYRATAFVRRYTQAPLNLLSRCLR